MANVAHTMSERDLRYVESGVSAVWDAELTRAQEQAYEIPLSFPGGSMIIRDHGEVPAWLTRTAKILEQLLWLGPNWDSYGALAVDIHEARAVLELLDGIMRDDVPAPQLVPTNRGGVQIEWHCSGIDIEIETLEPGRFVVSYEDTKRDEEDEWEQDLRSDWTRLSGLLIRLS